MWTNSASVVVVAHVVFLGEIECEQPTIRSNTELSRLLRHRLEVIEAALLRLIELQPRQPLHQEVRSHEKYQRHLP